MNKLDIVIRQLEVEATMRILLMIREYERQVKFARDCGVIK